MRLRREPEPSPETVRALAALDAALAGDTRRARARRAARRSPWPLREERPLPGPEFELALDLRAHEGFPREDATGIHTAAPAERKELHTPRRLRTTPLALATAASLFIVATAVLTTGLLGGGSETRLRVTSHRLSSRVRFRKAMRSAWRRPAPGTRPPRRCPRPARARPGASPPRPAAARSSAPPSSRLSTPRDQIEDVADGVVRVTDRHGGFVLSSSVVGGRGRAGRRPARPADPR